MQISRLLEAKNSPGRKCLPLPAPSVRPGVVLKMPAFNEMHQRRQLSQGRKYLEEAPAQDLHKAAVCTFEEPWFLLLGYSKLKISKSKM